MTIISRLASFGVIALAIIGFVGLVIGFGEDNALVRAYDVRVVLPDHMAFFKEAVIEGRLPLWSPHTFGGSPFLASPTTRIFYPTSLLYLVFQTPLALLLELIIHLFIAAAGTYLLARISYGISHISSLFAGLVYSISGGFVGHAFAGHTGIIIAMAYIPLLAFVVERAIDRLNSQPGFRAASTNFWIWLGALLLGLQLFSGGLHLVWIGMILIGLLRAGNVLISAPLDLKLWWREGLALVIIIIAGVLIAAVQFAPSYEFGTLSNRPRTWEYASQGSFHPANFAILLHPRATPYGVAFFWEHYAYIGLVPITLAIRGLMLMKQDNRIMVLAAVLIGLLLFMLGGYGFLFPLLWKFLPTFDIFRIPARAVIGVHLIISLLAAFGLDAISRWLRKGNGLFSRSARYVIAAIFIVVWIDIVSASQWYEKWLTTPVNRDLVSRGDHRSKANLANKIRHENILNQDRSWYRYWFEPANTRWNYAFEAGARNVGGYDVMMLSRYSNFLHRMTDNKIDRGLTIVDPANSNASTPFPFKILGLRYVDQAGQIRQQPDQTFLQRAWFVTGYREVADEASALEYMRGDAFRSHSEAVFEASAQGESAPSVVQENFFASDSGRMQHPVKVGVTDVTPENLLIDVNEHPPGFIVMSEIYYPGWEAEIDGVPIPLHRCNSILRCLEVAGSEEPTSIKVSFRPATVRWGLVVSIASLAIVVCALWLGRPRRVVLPSNPSSIRK